MAAKLQDELAFHHTAGVVHLVGVGNDADTASVVAAIRAEFEECHAWAVVVEVPEKAPFLPADTVSVAEELNRPADSWKICLETVDTRDLARLWHEDGREVRVTRP